MSEFNDLTLDPKIAATAISRQLFNSLADMIEKHGAAMIKICDDAKLASGAPEDVTAEIKISAVAGSIKHNGRRFMLSFTLDPEEDE